MNIKQTSSIKDSQATNKVQLNVGIINPGYGYERVSYALPPLESFAYKRLYTLPVHRIMSSHTKFYRETPVVFDYGVELLHTWNSLPVCRKPFVVSFECELPRYLGDVLPWQVSAGIKVLRSRRCQKILALSEAAKYRLIAEFKKKGYDDLIEKITVFRGGVSLPIEPKVDYPLEGALKLLFVGTDAVRKGIVPLFKACEALIKQGRNIHLTVIGGFSEECYVHGEFIPDIKAIETQLRESNWVSFMGRVAIADVLKQMKSHDLLMFPTFDESLGWVPVEAGLLGVPTVATDIFALPELIDHNKTGYLISIDKDRSRRFNGLDTVGEELCRHLNKANKDIELGLLSILEHLDDNRWLIEQWGRAAKDKLVVLYNPKVAASEINSIYRSAI